MLGNIARKIFGSKNDRELKRMGKTVQQINAFEETISALDDDQLKAKTTDFRERIKQGESLDQLLPEAFAVVREAGKRSLGLRHFDVQMLGGITLHQGHISEMRTGEGKTLVATLPIYLNALSGDGAYLVTVNDYLAERDANWMRPVYEFLGLSVGIVLSGQEPETKRAAYACDITYGTNNEFGFDYLRDNMAFTLEDRFQRNLNFAIVDEVDSILIDEARTPLIISGPADDSSELYRTVNALIPKLNEQTEETEGHFTIDEKARQIELTEQGHLYVEELLTEAGLLSEGDSLYSVSNLSMLQHFYSGLRAHKLFHNDVEYIVQNNQVVLIDEHTGRTMAGRRLSEGLHQAIEAKEGVHIQAESQTLASTTFQNYFRLFNKLSGMTGTADTEAFEFNQIYGLQVVVIPTNVVQLRKDLNDLIYLSKDEKYDAIVEDVRELRASGAPVLVGTASIETSEELSRRFDKAKLEHKVLNAKFHQQEAEIISQAGKPGMVTIATNMAGRGTDIVLGGNVESEIAALKNPTDTQLAALREDWEQRHQAVLDAGGLHIIGTERHESRRIDNQLRGRAGRQGDPGLSRFYLSMEDNLMRIFASDRVRNFMQALGMDKGEAIEHRMVTNSIEKAQRKVEGRNFDIRKQLLEYDDVANDQRQIVYQQRLELLEEDDISETIEAIRGDVINEVITEFIPPQSLEEQWDITGMEQRFEGEFSASLPIQQWLDEDDNLHEEPLREKITAAIAATYNAKADEIGPDIRRLEKHIMLQVLDNLWKEHLATMDQLRQGIHLRAYAQKNPKQEYKREAFSLFESMLDALKHDVVRFLANVQIQREDELEILERRRREEEAAKQMEFTHDAASAIESGEDTAESQEIPVEPFVREGKKVGRNELCPCGSGKKFKQCHGKLA
ncbi:MAG: preprotein translocase subunit SecA [Oceanicoccus sp.]